MRSKEEILSGPTCSVDEARRAFGLRWTYVRELIESKKVHSFQVGSRTRVSVESFKAYVRGDDGQTA